MKNHINSALIAFAVIVSGYLLAKGYQNRGKNTESIHVTGLGEENFTSDLIVWRASFSRKSETLKEAYSLLNQDQNTIRRYLLKKGIKNTEIVFSAVDIEKEYTYDYTENGNVRNTYFAGYNLGQTLTIKSNNVDRVEDLSRQVTELIDAGIELNSSSPEYYYTQLASLKLKMIEAATKDAKDRAEKIAENAGSSLGKLINADMGVFQITGENSSEDYSWGGSFNTSSKKKTANITIRLEYMVN